MDCVRRMLVRAKRAAASPPTSPCCVTPWAHCHSDIAPHAYLPTCTAVSQSLIAAEANTQDCLFAAGGNTGRSKALALDRPVLLQPQAIARLSNWAVPLQRDSSRVCHQGVRCEASKLALAPKASEKQARKYSAFPLLSGMDHASTCWNLALCGP